MVELRTLDPVPQETELVSPTLSDLLAQIQFTPSPSRDCTNTLMSEEEVQGNKGPDDDSAPMASEHHVDPDSTMLDLTSYLPGLGDMIFVVSDNEPPPQNETDEQRRLREERNTERDRRRATKLAPINQGARREARQPQRRQWRRNL
jgi:hypothetical protein